MGAANVNTMKASIIMNVHWTNIIGFNSKLANHIMYLYVIYNIGGNTSIPIQCIVVRDGLLINPCVHILYVMELDNNNVIDIISCYLDIHHQLQFSIF